jgi:hypothetical protein
MTLALRSNANAGNVKWDNISVYAADLELNAPITARNYLDTIAYADATGQLTYVEELPKVEYKDIIKANKFQGRNTCTAWVNFDGTTTPPTIRDSYNVASVIRTATGEFDIYFENNMDNPSFSAAGMGRSNNFVTTKSIATDLSKVGIKVVRHDNVIENEVNTQIIVFGGRK